MAVVGRQNLVILLGLSPSSSMEVSELRRFGNRVLQIKNSKVADQVRVGGRIFDLKQSSDLSAFGGTLGLSNSRAATLSTAIAEGGPNIRDELGQLAMIWAHAEHTHALPGRMVISGEQRHRDLLGTESQRNARLLPDQGHREHISAGGGCD